MKHDKLEIKLVKAWQPEISAELQIADMHRTASANKKHKFVKPQRYVRGVEQQQIGQFMQTAEPAKSFPVFDAKEYADYLDETVGIDENADNVR